jgi:hypothetical protein
MVALMALALFGLTQCRMVGDRLTGVGVSSFARAQAAQCIGQCQVTATQALTDEARRFAANIRACAGDPSCIQTETARHQAAVQAITDALRACISGCHHQGGGDGGN